MRVYKYTTELEDTRTVLVKEACISYRANEKVNLVNPSQIANFCRTELSLDRKAEEYVYAVAFDTKMKPIGLFEISHGTVNSSVVSPREIFIRLLLCGAVHTVLIHNHPSGDPTPSKEDISLTKRVADCGDLLGIKCLDHIIVGDDYGYYSFKENNQI